MVIVKNLNILQFLLLVPTLYSSTSIAQSANTSFCGKISIQPPLSLQTSIGSSPLSRILLCESQKLYFRTTLGLFDVSSIDYSTKTLTISHSSCSSSLHFISPTLLTAGFPSTPQLNSLLLFNCSSLKRPTSSTPCNCTSSFNGCRALSEPREENMKQVSSCWFVDDVENLEMGFDPKDLNCSHYKRVYRDSASSLSEGFKLGTRVSFGIPDHVPRPAVCDECNKPQGNCGVGLRCICHPHQCKDRVEDKVYSGSASMDPFGNVFAVCIFFITMLIFLM